MKFTAFPSLFFLSFFLCLLLLSSSSAISQHAVDSTDFYEKILLHPNADSDVSAAFNFYQQGVSNDLNQNDTISAVIKLRTLSIGHSEMGAIYESEATSINALELLDNLPETSETKFLKKGIYNDLGRVYRSLNSPAQALLYYDKALRISENASDSLIFINNKGNVYIDSGSHSLAKKEFELAYQLSQGLPNLHSQASILDNLGFAQSKLDKPEGLKNMLSALDKKLEQGELSTIYSNYRHLALHYHDRNKNDEARMYAQKAFQTAMKINSPSYIENALKNLLKTRGDSIGHRYIKLNDSIQEAKLQVQNKYAAMQYNVGKEREKTEATRLLQEKEKRKSQIFQIIGIFLTIILIGYYFFQKTLNKKKTLQQVYETETRISKKVHDEVANDVYHLMNKIQLESADNEMLLDDLESIYLKTRDISKENSELILRENFMDQLSELLQSYQQPGTVITIQNISKINWRSISDVKKTSLYRVLQELMTNMKKHSKASHVLISFDQTKSKIKVKYRDNGIGGLLKNKNGLLNVENRIKAINGSIIFDTEPGKGFKATIIV